MIETAELRAITEVKAGEPLGGHGQAWDWWLCSLLVCLLFTPTFRLPGYIPCRIDDLGVLAAAFVLAARYCFGGVPARRGVGLSLDWVALSIVLIAVTVGLSTLYALLVLKLPVTVKEYLDVARPAKFLLIYWLVKHRRPEATVPTFVRTMAAGVGILFVFALTQLYYLSSHSGILTSISIAYTDWAKDYALEVMSYRPFATFSTPPDLAYVSTMGLFMSAALLRWWMRYLVALAAFGTMLITWSRTFLFALPVLILLYLAVSSPSVRIGLVRLPRAVAAIAATSLLALVLIPVLTPRATEHLRVSIVSLATGTPSRDYNIESRLNNLRLVRGTWHLSKWLGVGTRALLPQYTDSELIITYHRYGAIGTAAMALLYIAAWGKAWQLRAARIDLSAFAIMTLVISLLYAATQASFISTRLGCFPVVVMGLVGATLRSESGQGMKVLS